MNDTGEEAIVRAGLDGALEDLLRAAVENPTEPCAANCARVDAVFDHRMAPHWHLAWAVEEAEGLKRRLKGGLRGHSLDAVSEMGSVRGPDLGKAHP